MPAIAVVLAVLATAAASPNSTCGDSCVAASDPVLLQLQSQQHRVQNIREELLADDSWKGPITEGFGVYGEIWTTRAPRATDYMRKVDGVWKWQIPKGSTRPPSGAVDNTPIDAALVKTLDSTNSWCLDKDTCGVTDPTKLEANILAKKITAVIFFIQDSEMKTIQSNNLKDFYKSIGLQVSRIPFGDFTAPGSKELGLAQSYISERLRQKQNVLMHCMGGTGRTGTLVVAALMGLQTSPSTGALSAAILQAKTLGKTGYIETNAQCAALCKTFNDPGCPQLPETDWACFEGNLAADYPQRFNAPHCGNNVPKGVPADTQCTAPQQYTTGVAMLPSGCWPCNAVCFGSSDSAGSCSIAPVGSAGSKLGN